MVNNVIITKIHPQSELMGLSFRGKKVNKDLDSGGEWLDKLFCFNVHSANPVGAENIQCILNHYLSFKESQSGKD